MHSTGYASIRKTTLLATNIESRIFPPPIIFKDKKITKGNERIQNNNSAWTTENEKTYIRFYLSNGLTRFFQKVCLLGMNITQRA